MDDVKKIIEAFDEYTKKSDYYEIFYSEKIGYFAMILDELNGELLDTAEQALWFFYNQVVINYKIEKANGGNVYYFLEETEKKELLNRIRYYTKKLEPQAKQIADDLLNDFLDNYGK